MITVLSIFIEVGIILFNNTLNNDGRKIIENEKIKTDIRLSDCINSIF